MRRLVICLDGTLNNAEQSVANVDTHKLFKPTNVLKTCRALLPVAADGASQIAYYVEGVGSVISEPVPFPRLYRISETLFGGGAGAGFLARVKSAYRFLVENFQDRDEIFIFGFSRGAAEALALARFIAWTEGLLHKDDEYYIVELFEGFRASTTEKTTVDELMEKINSRGHPRRDPTPAQEECRKREGENRRLLLPVVPSSGDRPAVPAQPRRKIEPARPVSIRFVGVYDTVIALGSRFKREGDVTTTPPEFAFLGGKRPPAIVERACQALAIDERRWDFRPQVWEDGAAGCQDTEQMWFPGVHSNVGGAYPDDGLANGALQWMLSQAAAAGVGFDPAYIKHFIPWVCSDRPSTDTLLYRLGELVRWKRGLGVRSLPAGAKLHESVAWLLLSDETYRPENLLQFLAASPQAIEQFPAPLQPRIRDIVAASAPGRGRR
jgi:uncharacterized protein (DUF2235 family)